MSDFYEAMDKATKFNSDLFKDFNGHEQTRIIKYVIALGIAHLGQHYDDLGVANPNDQVKSDIQETLEEMDRA